MKLKTLRRGKGKACLNSFPIHFESYPLQKLQIKFLHWACIFINYFYSFLFHTKLSYCVCASVEEPRNKQQKSIPRSAAFSWNK